MRAEAFTSACAHHEPQGCSGSWTFWSRRARPAVVSTGSTSGGLDRLDQRWVSTGLDQPTDWSQSVDVGLRRELDGIFMFGLRFS